VVVCPLCLIVPILTPHLLLRQVIRLFETFGKVQVYDFMRFDNGLNLNRWDSFSIKTVWWLNS
jgi:hypothetical protein